MRHTLSPEFRVCVNKVDAIRSLKRNKENHIARYNKASKAYIEEAIEALDDRIGMLKQGKVTDLHFDFAAPPSYAKDYTTLIEMLERHQTDILELTPSDYNAIMLDQWGWSGLFTSSTSSYLDDRDDSLTKAFSGFDDEC